MRAAQVPVEDGPLRIEVLQSTDRKVERVRVAVGSEMREARYETREDMGLE